MVEGSVAVDHCLDGGEVLELENGLSYKILHTPGHSKSSISLFFEDEQTLFTADALTYPGDLPIYEDIGACVASIEKLQRIDNAQILLPSWEDPIQGKEKISNE